MKNTGFKSEKTKKAPDKQGHTLNLEITRV